MTKSTTTSRRRGYMDDDDSDDTVGKSDYYILAFIIKLRFQEGSQSPILTI